MISTDLFIPSLNQSLDDDDPDRTFSLCMATESSLDDECFSNYTESMWCIYELNESALILADLHCHESKCQKRDGHKAKTTLF